MAAVDPAPLASPGSTAALAAGGSHPGHVSDAKDLQSSHPARCSGRRVIWVLGLLAGLASGALIHQSHEIIERRSEYLRELRSYGLGISAENMARFHVLKRHLHYQDTALTVGLVGLILCGGLGLGRGILQRSLRTSVFGVAGGALLGLSFGAAGGFADALLDLQFEKQQQLDPMFEAMIKHGVAWAGVAIAVGLTAVLPARRPGTILRVVLPAMAAGVAAAMAFVPGSAILFPNQFAEFAVPTGLGNRILWTSLPAILMTLVVGRSLSAKQQLQTSPKSP